MKSNDASFARSSHRCRLPPPPSPPPPQSTTPVASKEPWTDVAFFPSLRNVASLRGNLFILPPIEILGENGASMVDAFLPRWTCPLPCLCSVCAFYKRGCIVSGCVYFVGWFSSKKLTKKSTWVSVHEIMIHASDRVVRVVRTR